MSYGVELTHNLGERTRRKQCTYLHNYMLTVLTIPALGTAHRLFA